MGTDGDRGGMVLLYRRSAGRWMLPLSGKGEWIQAAPTVLLVAVARREYKNDSHSLGLFPRGITQSFE